MLDAAPADAYAARNDASRNLDVGMVRAPRARRERRLTADLQAAPLARPSDRRVFFVSEETMNSTTVIPTDLVTPLGAYLRLREAEPAAFLLESV